MKIYHFIILCIFVASCSAPQEPVFKRMTNFNIENFSSQEIVISADAIYFNQNSIGATLVSTDLDVQVNEKKVGEIHQPLSIKVEPKEEFSVPVKIVFPPTQLANGTLDFITAAAKIFEEKEMQMNYVGSLTVNIGGVPIKVPVDYSEVIPLFKQKNSEEN